MINLEEFLEEFPYLMFFVGLFLGFFISTIGNLCYSISAFFSVRVSEFYLKRKGEKND